MTRRRATQSAFLGLALVVATGCVERRLTIRSSPSNALVLLDGQEIGHTPCSVSFDYYGDRQVRLMKDGFETRTVNQKIAAPWYQWPGIDFVTEVLCPWRIRDDREYVYNLDPSLVVGTDELLDRASDVRARGQSPPPEVLRRAGVSQRAASGKASFETEIPRTN